MDLIIVLTCEYIFDELECVSYLTHININPQKYEYVYKEFNVIHIEHKKRIRKLYVDHSIDLSEYSNLLMIKFGNQFNYNITFPNTVLYLEFDESFNTKLSQLPSSLISLKLNVSWNHKLPILPRKLRQLCIGYKYTHELPKLSNNITHLTIGPLPHDKLGLKKLPSQLKYLNINYDFSHRFFNLPETLKYLEVFDYNEVDGPYKNDFTKKMNTLPRGLNTLIWDCATKLPRLPHHLKCLSVGINFNCELSKFPDELRYLTVGFALITTIIKLPNKLTHLYWYHKLKIPSLPNELVELGLGCDYSYSIPYLSSNMKKIKVHYEYKYIAQLQDMYSNIIEIYYHKN
jgi:hypothetical protein